MKFCKDCMHYQYYPPINYGSLTLCHHPKVEVRKVGVSPVSGPYDYPGDLVECHKARRGGLCGIEGDLWEEKPAYKSFISRFFSKDC